MSVVIRLLSKCSWFSSKLIVHTPPVGTSFHIVVSTKVWFFWWLNDVPLFHVPFENLNRAMIVIPSRSENGASLKKLILIRLKRRLNRTGHQVKPQTPKWRVTKSMARYWSYYSKALQWRRLSMSLNRRFKLFWLCFWLINLTIILFILHLVPTR